MKALVKTNRGPGNLELRNLPEPQINPDEVLIRVRACGICGSDLKIEDDQHPYTAQRGARWRQAPAALSPKGQDAVGGTRQPLGAARIRKRALQWALRQERSAPGEEARIAPRWLRR